MLQISLQFNSPTGMVGPKDPRLTPYSRHMKPTSNLDFLEAASGRGTAEKTPAQTQLALPFSIRSLPPWGTGAWATQTCGLTQ